MSDLLHNILSSFHWSFVASLSRFKKFHKKLNFLRLNSGKKKNNMYKTVDKQSYQQIRWSPLSSISLKGSVVNRTNGGSHEITPTVPLTRFIYPVLQSLSYERGNADMFSNKREIEDYKTPRK